MNGNHSDKPRLAEEIEELGVRVVRAGFAGLYQLARATPSSRLMRVRMCLFTSAIALATIGPISTQPV